MIFFTFHSSADRLPVDECLIIYVVDNLIQDFYNQALLYGIEISVGRVIGIVGKRRREIVFIVFRIRILYFDSDRQPVGGCDFIFLDTMGRWLYSVIWPSKRISPLLSVN